VQAPLALVAADLELNSLDRRQMPLTWHLLPEPAAVRLEQATLGALRDRLASAALLLGQVRAVCLWRACRVGCEQLSGCIEGGLERA
jgi:hypothetical protein